MGDLDLILGRLCRVARTGRPVALVFDYDGTLAPLRPTPAEAILCPAVRRALARLAARSAGGVGVVSGRALANLKDMVGLEGLYYAGTSGLEVDLLGRRFTPPGIERVLGPLDQIAGRLTDVSAEFPGAWVEQKPLGVTLHYRAVAGRNMAGLRLAAADALSPWAGRVRVEDETLGLEVIPDVGWNKGTAVRAILADMGSDALPVYIGDAVSDAPAMAAVDAAGGLSIGVGPTCRGGSTRLPGSGAVGSLAILMANVLHDAGSLIPAA